MTDWPIYVVIPALDEEESLPCVLADLAKLTSAGIREIIVVDNGSRDRTPEVARAGGATVLREPERGYGAACLKALDYISGAITHTTSSADSTETETEPADRDAIIVFLDADYSDYPEDLSQLVAPIREDRAELVIGSRLIDAQARACVPLPSRIGNGIATTVLRLLYGVRFTDLGPFRAIHHEALCELQMQDRTWGWTLEMQLEACRRGLITLEVPVRYRARHAGESTISGSLWGGTRAAGKILWLLATAIWSFTWRERTTPAWNRT